MIYHKQAVFIIIVDFNINLLENQSPIVKSLDSYLLRLNCHGKYINQPELLEHPKLLLIT